MSDRYEVIDENKLGRLLRGRGGEFEVYVGEDRSAHEIAAELNRLAEERDDAAINVKVYNHNRITLAKELGAIYAENDKLRAERDRLRELGDALAGAVKPLFAAENWGTGLVMTNLAPGESLALANAAKAWKEDKR